MLKLKKSSFKSSIALMLFVATGLAFHAALNKPDATHSFSQVASIIFSAKNSN